MNYIRFREAGSNSKMTISLDDGGYGYSLNIMQILKILCMNKKDNDDMYIVLFHLTLSEAESKPCRQYLYCKAEEFEHFHFIYDQIWEYKQRLDNENKKHDLTIVMPKNVVVRIELFGKFTNDDLQLLPRGNVTSLIF